ncbi:MAG: chemotaxis protein CheR [bacterium]|nr:chemotaxis protein CheR [bacterium]
MRDDDCIAFLQWALPRLRMRWRGLRKVRSQVRKRLARRLDELGLDDLDAYRVHLRDHSSEWAVLEAACRITISRFYRDRGLFESLGDEVLPALAAAAVERGATALRLWSAGCASGEEPYGVKMVWDFVTGPRFPALELLITATDADVHMLDRAQKGCYPASALRELPAAWKETAFRRTGDEFCLKRPRRRGIDFRRQDLRDAMPDGPFDMVLCRNLVFTYFEATQQLELFQKLLGKLSAGGALVIGAHETLPPGSRGIVPWPGTASVFRKLPVSLGDRHVRLGGHPQGLMMPGTPWNEA